jgi:hypothetical protein
MSIDNKAPAIEVNKDSEGRYVCTVRGAQAQWARVNTPEDMVDANGQPRKNKRGEPMRKWSTSLYLPKDAPGVKEMMAACQEIRKTDLKGAGKIVAIKDGNREIDRMVQDLGKDPAKLESMKDKVIVSCSSTLEPKVHNEVYSGCIAVAVITLASYDMEGSKGVKAYLNEIGRVAAGERIGGGGPRASVLAGSVQFEADDAPATGSGTSTDAPKADDAANPWEA